MKIGTILQNVCLPREADPRKKSDFVPKSCQKQVKKWVCKESAAKTNQKMA